MTTLRLCAHCCYRPVRTTGRGPHTIGRFCSDRCEEAARGMTYRAKRLAVITQIRHALALPAAGCELGLGELQVIAGRLSQLLELPDTGGHRGRRKVWAEHGTVKRYKQGCRQACCRAAETAYRRDLKARRVAEAAGGAEITPLPGHSERAA